MLFVQIHHKNFHAMASEHLTIRNVNRLSLSSQNLSLETNQRDQRSILRFSNPIAVKQTDHRIQVIVFISERFS